MAAVDVRYLPALPALPLPYFRGGCVLPCPDFRGGQPVAVVGFLAAAVVPVAMVGGGSGGRDGGAAGGRDGGDGRTVAIALLPAQKIAHPLRR